jgi:hypothetical protein
MVPPTTNIRSLASMPRIPAPLVLLPSSAGASGLRSRTGSGEDGVLGVDAVEPVTESTVLKKLPEFDVLPVDEVLDVEPDVEPDEPFGRGTTGPTRL